MLQGRAIHAFHSDEDATVFFANVVDDADVGMIQGRRGFCLPAKSFEGLVVMGKIFRQEFESNETVESGIFGFVDNTHATATELLHNAVMGDGLADERVGAGHVVHILGGDKKQVNERESLTVQASITNSQVKNYR